MQSTCECSSLKLQYDCLLNPTCFWNQNGTCTNINCSQIHYPAQCSANPNCFYNDTCHDLQACTDILGANAQECASQSIKCGSYDETDKSCLQFKEDACVNYTSQYDCVYAGKNSLCIWDDGNCEDFSCSLLNKQQCTLYSEYCTPVLSSLGNFSCVDATCDSKPTSDCTLTMTYGDNAKIQPCYVDTTQNPAICRNADLSDLNYVNCGINSLFTAAWSSNNTQSGNCQYCLDIIIQFGMLLMIIH